MVDSTVKEPISFGEGFRGIWRHTRAFKGTLVLITFLGLISAVTNGVVPYVTGRLFDTLIALSQGRVEHYGDIVLWAVVLGVWAITRMLSDSVDWWDDRLRRWLSTTIQLNIQADGFSHLLQLPLSFHTNEHIQAVFSRISAASWRITAIIRTMIRIVPQLLSIVIGIALALSINLELSLVLLIGVVVYTIALLFLLRGRAEIDHKAHQVWNESWDDAAAAVQQTSAVKESAAEPYEIERISKTLKGSVVNLWYQNELGWNRLNLWQRIVVFFTQLSIFVVSIHYVSAGIITVGELVTFNGYALMFFGPLVSLGDSWQVFQNGMTAASSLEKIFKVPHELYRPPNAHVNGTSPGEVEFRDVSFAYGPEQNPVLSHFSFSTKPGEVVAFVGESGVGKSTALSLLSGYYFPTEGAVLVEGIDTREWDLLALRSRIAVVPQEVALFNDTIGVNIRYGSFTSSDEDVAHAAQEAHIHDFIMSLPKKYETLVGERGIKLSVGQKQRVAIARAILRNPTFLVLDEPTSALDIETEKLITASLENLMRGRTTFIIAHRLSTVRKANKILVVKDGRIAEEGTHTQLLAKEKGIYRHLYELHVGLYE